MENKRSPITAESKKNLEECLTANIKELTDEVRSIFISIKKGEKAKIFLNTECSIPNVSEDTDELSYAMMVGEYVTIRACVVGC